MKEYEDLYNYEWDFTPDQLRIMEEKWQYIEKILPSDIQSIIDIGCGNGFFTNKFAEKFDTIGVDINEQNLKKIRTRTINSLAHELDLPENSIDLVFSSEMLEHLPNQEVLLKTVGVMKKIAKKYILISVPNDENLKSNMVKCGVCGFEFNSSFHNFSFNKNRLMELFKGFKLLHYNTIGPLYRPFKHDWLINIKHHIAHNWTVPNKDVSCPKCGNKENFVHERNLVSKMCYGINFFISRKKPAWIVMLLKKG